MNREKIGVERKIYVTNKNATICLFIIISQRVIWKSYIQLISKFHFTYTTTFYQHDITKILNITFYKNTIFVIIIIFMMIINERKFWY